MSRHAPVITNWGVSGSRVVVCWKVDDFFPAPEAPDRIDVVVNGHEYRRGSDLPRSTTEVTIPLTELRPFGDVVVIEVQFRWHDSGSADEVLVSSVMINLSEAGGGEVTTASAPPPTLRIRDIQPTTLRGVNRMTLEYSSYDWNKGTIVWGEVGGPQATKDIKPGGGVQADYSGKFTPAGPLLPSTSYVFEVTVRNTFQSVSGTSKIFARSASSYGSMRAFLRASGIHGPVSLREAGFRQSARATMGA